MNDYLPFLNSFEPNALMVFGLLLLCGVLGGMMANRIKWMPTITAFMIVGFVFGPHGFGLVTHSMLAGSKIIIDIALGLILYKLGNMLHPYELVRFHRLTWTALTESLISFLAVTLVMLACGYSAVLSILVGSIAISSSPAVLVHVAEELRAEGPITRKAKSLVATNNILAFVAFTIALPFALNLPQAEHSFWTILLLPAYHLAGSLVLGLAVGWLAARVAQTLRAHDGRYRFAIVIGAVVLTLGIAAMVQTSTLFATLSLGVATRWFEKRYHRLSNVRIGEGGELFFVTLFVMAGSKIDPHAVFAIGILPFLLVLARCAGKFTGISLVAFASSRDRAESSALTMLLIPMAGMAIGMTTALSNLVPELGEQVTAIIFAMVAVFEVIGPFAAVKAFQMSGEVGKCEDASEGA